MCAGRYRNARNVKSCLKMREQAKSEKERRNEMPQSARQPPERGAQTELAVAVIDVAAGLRTARSAILWSKTSTNWQTAMLSPPSECTPAENADEIAGQAMALARDSHRVTKRHAGKCWGIAQRVEIWRRQQGRPTYLKRAAGTYASCWQTSRAVWLSRIIEPGCRH